MLEAMNEATNACDQRLATRRRVPADRLSRGGRRATLLLLCAAALACSPLEDPPTPEADPTSLRSFPGGRAIGFASDHDTQAWRGLPFAKPPVGDLRWRAPRPPEPWTGTREALDFGPSCVQFASIGGGRDGAGSGDATGSEDCLYLNVFAPRFDPEEVPTEGHRLPVMLWIHGGGNTIGDAIFYNGSRLASEQRVLVVTIHYRLGVFGWFHHPSLRGIDTSPDDRSGNFGTLDIIRSLAWVQENIASFGGDPDRVLVFGESAGGSNAYSMLLSPRAKGLFHRTIAQSGSPRFVSRETAEHFTDDAIPGDPFSSGEVILKALIRDGRASDRASAKAEVLKLPKAELAGYLRNLNPGELLNLYDGSGMGGMYRLPRSVGDGVVLPEGSALAALEAGRYNRVPTIMGTNRDENKLFLLFGSELVTRLFGLPLWLKDEPAYQATAQYQTEAWKLRGVDAPATAMRKHQASVFGYRFDWDDEPNLLWLDLSSLLGAFHGLDVPFVFGGLTLGPATRLIFDPDDEAANRKLADAMMSYWGNFAYTGNPGRGRDGSLSVWQPWGEDAAGDKFILLDTDADGGLRMSGETISRESLLTRIASDPRLSNLESRCTLYRELIQRDDVLGEEDYRTLEGGRCREQGTLAGN